jgi:hypothetical protein
MDDGTSPIEAPDLLDREASGELPPIPDHDEES